MSSYRDLVVWQQSMGLATEIYGATRSYPAAEKFGIVSQMRRAATSIAANIAEGQARKTDGEFRRFLRIAQGSLAELETFLILSERLGYLATSDVKTFLNVCAEIGKMLNGLIKSLKTKKLTTDD